MTLLIRRLMLCLCVAFRPLVSLAEPTPPGPDIAGVNFQWGVAIPMRDGVKLSATVYTPAKQKSPAPCIFTLTPGGVVAEETMKDARPVTVTLYHDRGHPSTLYVPLGAAGG